MSARTVTPTLQRLAAPATHDPQRVFTTLAHLIDADVLHEAYRQTRKSSAAGLEGVTAKRSAEPLDDHRRDLQARLRSGRYQAAPVERVWLEQDDGGQRPSGQPAVADKMVQRAVARLLEALYEQDVHDCSDGVRPGRRPHAALPEVRERCRQEGLGWIVDADVSGYFDSIDRTRRQEVLRQRVNDGSMRRRMGKWRRAGVREDGVLSHPERGVVPGGVIAPVLANIVLHQVLEAWCEREVRPRRQGRGFLTRFAADFVSGCEREADARRIMAVLPTRFARDGFTIQPSKTTLMAFRKPEARQASAEGNGTVDVLGLTHDWTKSRRGYGVIKGRTARKRLRRTKKALWRWCRANRHAPRKDPYRMLGLNLRGQFQYEGIRGHFRVLDAVRRHAEKAWRDWLSRRSSTSAIGWETCQRLLQTSVLPTPKIVHTI